MTDASEWRGRVGDAWAEEWRRTDRSLAPVQAALLDTLLPRLPEGAAVLDIGCGAGSISLALAKARPDARVTGLDLSEALVEAARERAGGRARFEVGDASTWTPADGRRFDALVSRHGVMFFDDPFAAFAHLNSLTAPGGPFVFSCFRARDENPWAAELAPVIARFAPEAAAAPPPAQGPFAFADPERIRSILAAAGFAAPEIVPLDVEFVTGEGPDPLAETLAYFRRIGPFAALLRELDAPRRDEALAMVEAIAAARRSGDRIVFPAAVWIVTCASG
ncbi:MAG: class I SAM-dependent methyltransferase [Sphingosinicella sp.]|uniref:class I SAM-dependent methyltransferase n=1 Tax=Sphingosinicella sp. TaxID=1917971 RepID=UPI0040378759